MLIVGVCRYHPACVGMNAEQAKELDHFDCSDCASDMDVKKSRNTALTNGKVSLHESTSSSWLL